MARIGKGIADIIKRKEAAIPDVKEMVDDLTKKYPLFL